MTTAVIRVDGMSCEHCVKAIIKAVGALDGIENVAVNLEGKTVTVEYDPIKSPLDKINQEIEEQGYDIQ
ncbi:copper ion binding protein [Parasporobacterium paucivorans]|uniref:Copper chaperone n=1 Tax=Parasporobacterium paucivorans DSM 15970 TaxID=1122934 RepID=A0A1M6E1E5_9FIRM|nr:copper ion binding protein [Parasporobacterium paucivorans]SHI79332.1 copper chaperone [Parasporobacterium paucivorans DSM 15970]